MEPKTVIKDFIKKRYLGTRKNFELQDDTLLLEAKIIDSMGVIELIAFVEETFDIEIDDDELLPENFNTVNNLLKFLDSKKANSAAV